MEDEKKKRKNKKKKNKQSKTVEDTSVSGGETASVDLNHVDGLADVQNNVVQKLGADPDQHRTNGTEGTILAEAEKKYWLQREASLEETIKRLQSENDSYIQKEADLEMRNVQLQGEKNSWLEKEAFLEEKISAVLDEKTTLGLKKAILEDKIKHLEIEKDSCALKEALTIERIASLTDGTTELQAQVKELEKSKNNLLQENQQLMEKISGLHSQIEKLERSNSIHTPNEISKQALEEDMNFQMEATDALVQKLITENSELVEKVNKLYMELDQRNPTVNLSTTIEPNSNIETMENESIAYETQQSSEKAHISGDDGIEKMENIPIKDERNNIIYNKNGDFGASIPIQNGEFQNVSEISESEEITAISSDENETREVEVQGLEGDMVPLSDAPLIGAPFRLIFFFAKYVSGADLVSKS